VAFGVVAMLVLEGRPTEVLDEVVDFRLDVGLPVTLGDVDVDAESADLAAVAEAACAEGETIHNLPFPVDPAMVVDAIVAADLYGQERRALRERSRPLPAVASRAPLRRPRSARADTRLRRPGAAAARPPWRASSR
jgi:glycerol dehydrogenase